MSRAIRVQLEDGIRERSETGVQTSAFFFSSRRRHTRFKCDWSSDVCSSDLFACTSLNMPRRMRNSHTSTRLNARDVFWACLQERQSEDTCGLIMRDRKRVV